MDSLEEVMAAVQMEEGAGEDELPPYVRLELAFQRLLERNDDEALARYDSMLAELYETPAELQRKKYQLTPSFVMMEEHICVMPSLVRTKCVLNLKYTAEALLETGTTFLKRVGSRMASLLEKASATKPASGASEDEYLRSANELLASREYRRAREVLTEGMLRNDRSSRLCAAVGYAYLLEGKLEKAVRHLARAILLDPSGPPAFFYMARALADAGMMAHANSYYSRFKSLCSDSSLFDEENIREWNMILHTTLLLEGEGEYEVESEDGETYSGSLPAQLQLEGGFYSINTLSPSGIPFRGGFVLKKGRKYRLTVDRKGQGTLEDLSAKATLLDESGDEKPAHEVIEPYLRAEPGMEKREDEQSGR